MFYFYKYDERRKNMKKIILTTAGLTLAAIISGCGSNVMATQKDTVSQTQAVQKNITDNTSDVNTPDADELWGEAELNGYGEVYYPGFELTDSIIDKITYRSLITEDGRLRVTDRGYNYASGKTLVRVEDLETQDFMEEFEIEGRLTLTEVPYKESEAPRLLYRDVTGDGTKDLIIRINSYYGAPGYDNKCSCYILDGASYKPVQISVDDYFTSFESNVDISYETSEDEKLTVTAILKDTGETLTYVEEAESDVPVSAVGLWSDYQYVYFEDGDVYAGFWVAVSRTDEEKNIYDTEEKILIYNKLDYNIETGIFELSDSYYMDDSVRIATYSEVSEDDRAAASAKYAEATSDK